jgi:hypothetical protein
VGNFMTTLRALRRQVPRAVLFALAALPLLSPSARADAPREWRLEEGRLEAVPSGALGAAAGQPLRGGLLYEVAGLAEAKVSGPGASFRAMPGTRLRLTSNGGRPVLQVDDGVVNDVVSDGALDVLTPAGTVRTDRARVFVKVDVPAQVYVEHKQGSTGRVEIATGAANDGVLAAGTFRSYASAPPSATPVPAPLPVPAPGAGTTVAATTAPAVPAIGPTPVRVLPTAAPAPAQPPPGDDWIEIRPARTEWKRVPCAPGTIREGEQVQDCWELVQIPAEYARRDVPCPPPPPPAPAPCPPPPACAPCEPTGVVCGGLMRWGVVPVPVRADDTGRPPLGSAIGARGECENCVGTECNRIPWVMYAEGSACDVATYKVGCCLVTVRPACLVRVHRLPDGSLQIWGPNLGCHLAMIEINENQAGYIGNDGFLVVGSDCQIEYFRGLVHLYKRRRGGLGYRVPRDRTVPSTEDEVTTPIPLDRTRR